MAKTFYVNGERFGTQSALVSRVREILKSYRNREMLSASDTDFMFDLLLRHPRAEKKIGVGVDKIYVSDNPSHPGHSSRGFWLMRSDGTETDFSFWECIRPSSHSQKVKSAFRISVEPDIIAFKQSVFGESAIIHCPDTGERIAMNQAHVDHKAPKTFEALMGTFLSIQQVNIDDIALEDSQDNECRYRLIDFELEQQWIDFHRKNAVLEVVSIEANLSIRRRNSTRSILPTTYLK